jgi:hypothetical protein
MAVSFATNIRPMFTDMDIAHMKNCPLIRTCVPAVRSPTMTG